MCQEPGTRPGWRVLTGRVELGPGEVHVWRIPLDPDGATLVALEGLLSADERDRASRFKFARHRRRFVAGRGRVRELLGRYAGCAPGVLTFEYGRFGKPRLSGSSFGRDIRFNFSNSHELGLLAVAVGLEVGVDLERIKPMADHLRLAERFFTQRESAALAALPEAERLAAFFRCWTRKEAFLKAIGDGLHFDLDRVEVAVAPGERPELRSVDGDSSARERWTLRDIDPGEGYTGALVTDGPIDRVEFLSYPS